MKITESIIAKSGLSPGEAKVVRCYYVLRTGGKRTKKWVRALSPKKYNQLLASAQEKIRQTLGNQRAGN